MKTDIIQLLETKQLWEMSDMELAKVKLELLRMNTKVHQEQSLRAIAEGDTPLGLEVYGG